jgi:hypothetical protein
MASFRRTWGAATFGWVALVGAIAHSSLLNCNPVVGRFVGPTGGLCESGSLAACGGTCINGGEHECSVSGTAGSGELGTGGDGEAVCVPNGTLTLAYLEPTASEEAAISCFGSFGNQGELSLKVSTVAEKEGIFTLRSPGDGSWDLALVNGGSDVLRLAGEVRSGDGPGLFELDSLRSSGSVMGHYFREVMWPVSWACEADTDRTFALPVGIHRTNVLLVNTDLVQDVIGLALSSHLSVDECNTVRAVREGFCMSGIQSLDCLSEPETDCSESGFRSVGALVDFLELSTKFPPTWTCTETVTKPFVMAEDWLNLLFYEDIMPSHKGLYEHVWPGASVVPSEPKDINYCDEVDALLLEFERLMRVTLVKGSWDKAVRSVAAGCALATAMGDWGTVALRAENLGDSASSACAAKAEGRIVDTPDISIRPFPGTSETFVFASDVAVSRVGLDLDDSDPKACAARAWFSDVVGNRDVLSHYWQLKGSIPPMSDAVLVNPSQYQLEAYEEYKRCRESDSNCQLLRAVSGVAHPSVAGGMTNGGAGGLGECEQNPLGDEDSSTSNIEHFLYQLWGHLKDCQVTKEIGACNDVVDGTVGKVEDHIKRVLNDTIARGPYCPDIP